MLLSPLAFRCWRDTLHIMRKHHFDEPNGREATVLKYAAAVLLVIVVPHVAVADQDGDSESSAATCSCSCDCAGSGATATATATATASATGPEQPPSTTPLGGDASAGGFRFEPVGLRVATHLYFSEEPDPGEIDPWKSNVSFKMVALDFSWGSDTVRGGFSPSFGTLPLNDANGLVVMVGPFLQYKDLFRFEAGWGYAYSYDASKDATTRDNTAVYVGFGFPKALFGP